MSQQQRGSPDRRFNLSEFQQRTNEFQDKKEKRLAKLREQQELQAVAGCTFTPNQMGAAPKAKSVARPGSKRNP